MNLQQHKQYTQQLNLLRLLQAIKQEYPEQGEIANRALKDKIKSANRKLDELAKGNFHTYPGDTIYTKFGFTKLTKNFPRAFNYIRIRAIERLTKQGL